MLPPIFPITVPALAPLHPYAPLVWLLGLVCLWLTRYTHQLGKRWGGAYYRLSALLRPAGVLLIAMGWLAVFTPRYNADIPRQALWLPRHSPVDLLLWVAIAGSFAFGVWSVAALGLRRSFLFRRVEDRLLTTGPYALVRHPQFLASIGIALFSALLFDPFAVSSPFLDPHYYTQPPMVNWVLFALATWGLSLLEDRELAAHFGAEYEAYARRVPRLFPN